MFLHLSVMRATFYLEENIVGPSDVRGFCPEESYLYTDTYGMENCCCGDGSDHECCWANCTWKNPPERCLPFGAEWVHNYYWDTINGKVTERYVATYKGNFGKQGQLVPVRGNIPGGHFICRAQADKHKEKVGTM